MEIDYNFFLKTIDEIFSVWTLIITNDIPNVHIKFWRVK
jgi:hypothetical protein